MERALIIDDDQLLIYAISKLLLDYYPEVKAASNGDEALLEIGAFHYDLCLLEIALPGLDGLFLLRKIRELSPDTKVVVMTGTPLRDEMQKEIEKLSFCFMAKPFEISELQEVAVKALERAGEGPHGIGKRSRIKTFVKTIDYSINVLEMGKPINLPLKGDVVDITKFGIGIRTPYPLEPGQLLMFTSGLDHAEQKAGIVRWSRMIDDSFMHHAGVEFIEDGRSHPEGLQH